MTNADKIRAMTDEEIAALFTMEYNGGMVYTCPVISTDCENDICDECFLRWLKQEAKE